MLIWLLPHHYVLTKRCFLFFFFIFNIFVIVNNSFIYFPFLSFSVLQAASLLGRFAYPIPRSATMVSDNTLD